MTDRQRLRQAEIEQLWRYQTALKRLHAAEARSKLVKHAPIHTDTTGMKKNRNHLLTLKKK